MTWTPKVESLRKYVLWECRDVPPDLVLAIINNESGGEPGIRAHVKCKCGEIPDVNGIQHRICYAYGLMQCIPSLVQWYNTMTEDAEKKATIEDLQGSDERAIRIQIRIGCMFLAYCNRYLHKKFPEACPAETLAKADNDQIAIVSTAYAVGHGATARKLEALQKSGMELTFKNLLVQFPDWGRNKQGKQVNNPLKYAQKISRNFQRNYTQSYEVSSPLDLVRRTASKVPPATIAIIVAIGLAGIGYLIQRHDLTPGGLF